MSDFGLGLDFGLPPRIEALKKIADSINFEENVGTVDEWLELYEKAIVALRRQKDVKTSHDTFAVMADYAHLVCQPEGEHIPSEQRKEVYREAIERFGEDAQQNKFAEELGEFLTEYGRLRNGAHNLAAFAEELADLCIMLEQLAMIYCVEEVVADQMDYKVCRLAGRLSAEGGAIDA